MTECKLVVMGSAGVGKSALVIQFVQHHFVASYDPTIEDLFRLCIVVDEIPCVLEIVDTAGDDQYSVAQEVRIRRGEGFFVCICY